MRHVSARRPSPALAISIVALFVALGGSAYAASKVGTKDIEDRAITAKKLRKGAVATGRIRKHAVNTKRLHKNAITTGKIRNSAITTEKIGGDAVTGEKVDEATLSQVPNAASADDRQASRERPPAENSNNLEPLRHQRVAQGRHRPDDRARLGRAVHLLRPLYRTRHRRS